MAVYRVQDTSLTAVADAIRAKAGTSDALTFPDGFVEAVGGIQAGGGGAAGISPKDVNFYDYDGTCVHAYTVAEAQALSELPAGPEHPGLVFQGWNWSLEGVKGLTRAMNIGAMYITDDGTTRLYITLQEGRTSPMLGVGVNGTVTVDWGDGTEPDVLTGTSKGTVKWTQNHPYSAPGDYVIRLTVNGEICLFGSYSDNNSAYLLRYTNGSSKINNVYQNALKRAEIGENVEIGQSAFDHCFSLAFVSLPSNVTSIGAYAFQYCYHLSFLTIPDGVATIGSYAFYRCTRFVTMAIPSSVMSIGQNSVSYCYIISFLTIPDGVATIGSYAFTNSDSLVFAVLPGSIEKINSSTFKNAEGMAYYDFTACTAVPTLAATSAFDSIPADCEIRVPAALYDEWIAATNWATYAANIKAY